MPSWGDHSDQELWATVAFVEKLPEHNRPGLRKACRDEPSARQPPGAGPRA